ncbi:hypothetical protein [Streptosporangium lutulentum]|uniref:Uncharacterized protein n=1 Tax=Streptosporangium lutulentum TaxID=1461250 RepID=A0ABT9QA58_9ACTN|nr:hypothetical protein [Streptosporangium lutulentum]MDP9843647.1 hypothetical protein [Streptosporangium lutulentum]
MAHRHASDASGPELGRFLYARRTQTSPGQVGLTVGTGLRRTPGLRREEVAEPGTPDHDALLLLDMTASHPAAGLSTRDREQPRTQP